MPAHIITSGECSVIDLSLLDGVCAENRGNVRSLSLLSLATVFAIGAADGGQMTTRAVAERYRMPCTGAWNMLHRLMMAGYLCRAGRSWGLTDAGSALVSSLTRAEDEYPPGWDDAAE